MSIVIDIEQLDILSNVLTAEQTKAIQDGTSRMFSRLQQCRRIVALENAETTISGRVNVSQPGFGSK